MEKYIKLETKNLMVEFDYSSGSLVSIYSKISDWYIFSRPHLALSWRLMLPLEGRRNNNAWGHMQDKKPSCTCEDKKITFHWDTVNSKFGGEHNISVTTVCEIVNEQVVFRMHIKNNDKIIVENVYYPYIGDMHRPIDCERFSFCYPNYIGMSTFEMFPIFTNWIGTHSVDFPTLTMPGMSNPPMSPFGIATDEKGNGLYIGIAERRIEVATWHAEAHPGWRNSNDFRVFSEDTFEGKDVFNRFAVGHLPYISPGSEFDLLPFAMEAYKGGWETGVSCYTKTSRQWNKSASENMPSWAKGPHSWLQIQINSPEDELRIKFKDLPKVGEECKKYGIKAIQLVGWNEGGQDRGNPNHNPDPRLGTYEELKNAIAEIKAMGVKVILFAKFTWADESNDDFKEKFEPLAIKDPYRNYYVHNGYQYMTLSQLSNINTHRLIPMCFHSDKYMEICKHDFKKCVDLGADGILYDECQHHSPALCCFDTSHGHRFGEAVYKKDETLIDNFRKILNGKEFLIAGEAIYDFQFNYYDISYGRTWGKSHIPVSRLMRPHGGIMTAVIGFNDRSMINQCLLNRYIISYEPFNFKGMLSDFPSTVAYGQKMDKLRTDLRDYFWDGEFLATQGAKVKLLDESEHESYTVFSSTDGKIGLIICNYDEQNPIEVKPCLDNGEKLTKYRLVDDDDMSFFTDTIIIPPMSAVAVI